MVAPHDGRFQQDINGFDLDQAGMVPVSASTVSVGTETGASVKRVPEFHAKNDCTRVAPNKFAMTLEPPILMPLVRSMSLFHSSVKMKPPGKSLGQLPAQAIRRGFNGTSCRDRVDAALKLMLLATLVSTSPGCRAIRRLGDSRQTIAARRLSGQGFQAMHDGRWDIAETLFTDALSVSNSDDRAHWGLAESYWERGERDLAIEHMEKAVRLSAGDPKLVQRLGRMYLEVGRIEAADEHSLWALQLNRDSEDVWALRGDCLRAAGNDTKALAAYHRALALRPDFQEVQLEAAEIYQAQGRFDRVLATLDRLQDGVGIEATEPRADMLQGIAMRQLGRHEQAKQCFLRAATKDPKVAAPHLELADLALHWGQVDAAQASLSRAMKLNRLSGREGQRWQELQQEQQRLASELTEPGSTTQRR
jgi:tetratricopeptide (TPR) repeat protein